MSFLSGVLSIGKSVVGFLSGSSIASSLAKTVLMGYALNRLSRNATKGNDINTTPNIDQGVRLQLSPNAESKIPVLYGSAFFGGNINDAAMTNSNRTMWYSIVLTEKVGTKIGGGATTYTFNNVYWNDQRVVFNADGITVNYTVDRQGNIDRSLNNLVKIYCYRGNSSSGVVPSGYTGTVPNAFTLFPNWTSGTHPMDNLIFALVRVDYNREKNVTGIGNLLFQVTNDMFQPGNVLLDYLTNSRYGCGISEDDINISSLTALNTYSAENLAYDDQGTGLENLEDRYQINGLLDTSKDVLSNVEKICNAAASWLGYDITTGTWGVIINKPETAVATFTDKEILGTIDVSGTGLQDLYNNVKVEFPHRDLRDTGDFVNIELDEEFRNANEEDNTLNISYDIINEPIQAQLLGFIELKQSRIDLIIRFQTDFSKINLKAGEVIAVTNNRFGFTNKLFRIISISEMHEDGEPLMVDITALEYDAGVYATDDLFRFTRSDSNGIITIGSIGTPGTPDVTKFEVDVRPRVIISSTSPTGIVEGMEYWLTTDVNQADDALRSYTLIGIRRPVGGGVFTSGTVVTLEYDAIGNSNFLVKTRGINTTTSGPFSNTSGSVFFAPVQTTDAITPDTLAFDSTGGLLTALALTTLLSKLGDLFGSDGSRSLFDQIFKVFKDETGVDLVGEASEGTLVVASDITIKKDGSQIADKVASINFEGNVEVTATGNDITVKVDGLPDGNKYNQVLTWDGEKWVLTDSCCPGPTIPDNLKTNPEWFAGVFQVIGIWSDGRFPPDKSNILEPTINQPANQAPITGSYYFKVGRGISPSSTTATNNPLYGPLVVGQGSIRLYKSDGTLVESLNASQLIIDRNLVEVPFATRELGTDYYILMDEGLIKYCKQDLPAITSPTNWNFNTALTSTTPYSVTANNFGSSPNRTKYFLSYINTPFTSSSIKCEEFSFTISVNPFVDGQTNSTALRAYIITTGVGNIEIRDSSNDQIVATIPASTGIVGPEPTLIGFGNTISGVNTITYNASGLSAGKSYYLTINEGAIFGVNRYSRTSTSTGWSVFNESQPSYDCYAGNLDTTNISRISSVITKASNWAFNTKPLLNLTSWSVQPNTAAASRQTHITLNFNTEVGYADKTKSFYIYNDSGTLHQQITPNIGSNLIIFSSSSVINLNPTKDFDANTTYYVLIDNGFLNNNCNEGIAYAGITDPNIIRFTTGST